ncbi:hypothetical protein GCK72_024725 [Caenorhabditis remanei]|uniref:Uncharacterized protein n=1 Tax=Caenorhabditis remanei TaxID=31234 RepID=A0A6A5G008_CAERE|nr:hypothetical protein GCK72_024725 [Caenorhabditis remanei]KAF1748258.1 hypothetical protein GCK72_024725 [Caenorhabditis remanei]
MEKWIPPFNTVCMKLNGSFPFPGREKMEAVAEHDFLAGSNDELSFKRGDVLKVLNKDEDPHWYKAELDGNEGFIPSNYIRMTDCNWYLGEITRKDAEVLLKKPNIRDGHFLVRQCENSPGEFSISVRFQDSVHHFKVVRDQNGKYYLCSIKFNSLNELGCLSLENSYGSSGEHERRDEK